MRRGFAPAAGLLVAVTLAGCAAGGSTPAASPTVTAAAASAPCSGVLVPPAAAAVLPAGFPSLEGQVLYGPRMLGKTLIVMGRLPTPDFLRVRDDLLGRLRAAGYTISGTDQESVEAEAQFTGPQSGTIQVVPLCTGNVSVRYKFLG